METGKIQEFRERAKAYFDSKTPTHIITIQDSWINGFIVSVSEHHFEVLDKGKEQPTKVHYIDIYIFEAYRGPVSKLRIPEEVQKLYDIGLRGLE